MRPNDLYVLMLIGSLGGSTSAAYAAQPEIDSLHVAEGPTGFAAFYAVYFGQSCAAVSVDGPDCTTPAPQPHFLAPDADGIPSHDSVVDDFGGQTGTSLLAPTELVSAGIASWLVHNEVDAFFLADELQDQAPAALATTSPSAWAPAADGWFRIGVTGGAQSVYQLVHTTIDGVDVHVATLDATTTDLLPPVVAVTVDGSASVLVASVTGDGFFAQRFDVTGTPIDVQPVMIRPGPVVEPDVVVSSTITGWLVYTSDGTTEVLIGVGSDGAQTSRALPARSHPDSHLRFAEPGTSGALWFELDEDAVAADAVYVPLTVTPLSSDGTPAGDSIMLGDITTTFSIAADVNQFLLAYARDSDVHIGWYPGDASYSKVTTRSYASGCSVYPGGAPRMSPACLILVAMVLAWVRRAQKRSRIHAMRSL